MDSKPHRDRTGPHKIRQETGLGLAVQGAKKRKENVALDHFHSFFKSIKKLSGCTKIRKDAICPQ